MRNGYILLHRKGLTQDEWKHPLRTLAWIDFCTMAAWEDFVAEDGVRIGRGEVLASYGFLATRWHVSKDTAYQWVRHWIAERQVERRAERCTERSAERFFVLNYAKYQDTTERVAERSPERPAERVAEQMKGIQGELKQENQNTVKGYGVRVETEVLCETIEGLCKKYGLKYDVNPKALDVYVDRYVGKVRMKVEVQHCIAWLIGKGYENVTANNIGNWFKKAQEIQKKEERRQLDRKDKMNQDPALRKPSPAVDAVPAMSE